MTFLIMPANEHGALPHGSRACCRTFDEVRDEEAPVVREGRVGDDDLLVEQVHARVQRAVLDERRQRA